MVQQQVPTPAPLQYSPDGRFWWDGTQWVAVPVLKRRYGHTSRALYGMLWAFWTVALTLGGLAAIRSGFSALSGPTDNTSLYTALGTTPSSTPGSGPGSIVIGLILLGLAGLAGRYDYRIWTWQARRLWFFIIF